MAAFAICAVTAAQARTRAPAPILPTAPHEQPPDDPGLITLTVAEIKRLFNLATRKLQRKSTTCAGSGGAADTKHERNGSTTAPDYAANQPQPD
jgi:hypothetical protein